MVSRETLKGDNMDTIYVLSTDWNGPVGYYLPTVVPTGSQEAIIKFFANELASAEVFGSTQEALEAYQNLWCYDVFDTNRITY